MNTKIIDTMFSTKNKEKSINDEFKKIAKELLSNIDPAIFEPNFIEEQWSKESIKKLQLKLK